jgi:hypothetical protein
MTIQTADYEQGIHVDRFKPGDGNPQQPTEPVKEPGGTGATLLVGGLLLVFAVVVAALLYLVFSS